LSTINPTWSDPAANPGLGVEMPATNCLSYGTAYGGSYNSYIVSMKRLLGKEYVEQAVVTNYFGTVSLKLLKRGSKSPGHMVMR
jgi:hypothetical protein